MSAVPQLNNRLIANTESTASDEQYSAAVNPQWIRLLKLLEMNVHYERCVGELFTTQGKRIIDFLSGYCVHNLGHNHPAIIDVQQAHNKIKQLRDSSAHGSATA